MTVKVAGYDTRVVAIDINLNMNLDINISCSGNDQSLDAYAIPLFFKRFASSRVKRMLAAFDLT